MQNQGEGDGYCYLRSAIDADSRGGACPSLRYGPGASLTKQTERIPDTIRANQRRERPFRVDGGRRGKGAPSSGEKIVFGFLQPIRFEPATTPSPLCH